MCTYFTKYLHILGHLSAHAFFIATFMIAQINTGRGFGGLVNYANDIAHKNTVIIASAGVNTTTKCHYRCQFQGTGSDASITEEFRGTHIADFPP